MQATCVQPATGLVEWITDGEETLAVLIRAEMQPDATTFLTPPDYRQQVGFVVHPAGSEIPRHDHLSLQRSITGTSECLIVRRGRSEVTIYNRQRREVCRRELQDRRRAAAGRRRPRFPPDRGHGLPGDQAGALPRHSRKGTVLIPVNEPWLGDAEVEAAANAVRSGWISGQGEYVREFEERWAALCQRRHGISVSSGTAALETAIHALRLPQGSEMIMPAFTMISCLAAVLRNGLVPVFVDADPRTWCMDVEQVAAKVTRRTAAIMAVHIYGHPVDMDPLLAVATKHGLKVVEDAAEAHGARYRGRVCGSFGDASAFSFYSNKIVATGEGGMVVCDDETVADDCRNYRNLYFDRQYRFLHGRLGHNFRLTNVQAAIGCAQIDRLPEALRRKARMARLYDQTAGRPARSATARPAPRAATTSTGSTASCSATSTRWTPSNCSRQLRERGVDSRPFFLGMHEQPVARDSGFGVGEGYPVAERLSRRGLYLPSGLAITEQQIETVAETLKVCLGAVTV